MKLDSANRTREVLAGAKLNLFLEVLSRRDDGFHEIETLMVPVSLFDTLRLNGGLASSSDQSQPAAGAEHAEPTVTLKVETTVGRPAAAASAVEELPEGTDNIVVRAVRLLGQQARLPPSVALGLFKRIPIASGMAGGSSDAAAALRLAAETCTSEVPADELVRLAARLGSDVPFFLGRGPAVCRGRGERIEPVSGLGVLHFVIVRPPVGLSTADVYRACQPARQPQRVEPLVAALRRGDLRDAGQRLHNRLQPAAEKLCPAIARMAREFDRCDFLGHRMSGSGTSYFGLCRHAGHARRLAARLRALRLGSVWHVQSVLQSPALI